MKSTEKEKKRKLTQVEGLIKVQGHLHLVPEEPEGQHHTAQLNPGLAQDTFNAQVIMISNLNGGTKGKIHEWNGLIKENKVLSSNSFWI
jgi:hypothetical protein